MLFRHSGRPLALCHHLASAAGAGVVAGGGARAKEPEEDSLLDLCAGQLLPVDFLYTDHVYELSL